LAALGQGAWVGGILLTGWTAVTALRAGRDPAFAWVGIALGVASIAAVFVL